MNFDVEPGEFVQILNNGRGHWLTISTIGTTHPEVQVYDSMYMFANQCIVAQTASLLHTNHSAITLSFMDTQKQCGQCDCGLFAVAFATALVFGEHPGTHFFDQQGMRRHLWKCLERRQMSMFPVKKIRRGTPTVKTTEDVEVFCVCRMPDMRSDDDKWIECTKCKEWYHVDTCVKVSESVLQAVKEPWFCGNCV